ncbi:MAG: GGDEF domain-containing phosphodiesterase [Azospirillaceae bacterium]
MCLVLAYAVVYWTGGTRLAFVHLAYVPILFGAALFGMLGSLLAAVAAAIAFGPMMPLSVAEGLAQPVESWLVRGGFFVVIAAGAGLAVGRGRLEADKVRAMAFRDPGSGLLNKAAFLEALAAPARQKASQCLMLQIEGFDDRQVVLGPSMADEWIGELIEERLIPAAAAHGPLFRIRSDRFGLILGDADTDRAVEIGKRLLDAVAVPLRPSGLHAQAEGRVGLAAVVRGDPQQTFAAAASAVEIARAHQRRHVVFDAEANATQRADIALLDDFRAALSSGDGFALHFQPKVTLRDGRCDGAEALFRWTHPSAGPVSPGRLFPLLERTSLMHPLTRWVIGEAARTLTSDDLPAGFSLAVNVSVRDLEDAEFPDFVADVLDRHALSGTRLEVEVTETAFVTDLDRVIESLAALRRLGVRVAIDDFGTGHCSLDYLKRLPIDVIKIDREFIAAIPARFDSAIVQSALMLAGRLDCAVVAEGVETAEIHRHLRYWGCTYGQGYFYARPMPADQLRDLLRAPDRLSWQTA